MGNTQTNNTSIPQLTAHYQMTVPYLLNMRTGDRAYMFFDWTSRDKIIVATTVNGIHKKLVEIDLIRDKKNPRVNFTYHDLDYYVNGRGDTYMQGDAIHYRSPYCELSQDEEPFNGKWGRMFDAQHCEITIHQKFIDPMADKHAETYEKLDAIMTKIAALEQKIEELQYAPGMSGYQAAKAEFEALTSA